MKKTYDYVVPLSEMKQTSVIVGVGSVESSYLIQVLLTYTYVVKQVEVFLDTFFVQ